VSWYEKEEGVRVVEGNMAVIKLSDGEDFFSSLRRELESLKVDSGLVLSGIGMMREVKLGYFEGEGEYGETTEGGPLELTSMQGNIALSEGDLVFHLHVTGALPDGSVRGGHLLSGIVHVVNEIALLRLGTIRLERRRNDVTGLLELHLGPPETES
jgi:predicted DNA-binding protein with PD1-like motif